MIVAARWCRDAISSVLFVDRWPLGEVAKLPGARGYQARISLGTGTIRRRFTDQRTALDYVEKTIDDQVRAQLGGEAQAALLAAGL